MEKIHLFASGKGNALGGGVSQMKITKQDSTSKESFKEPQENIISWVIRGSFMPIFHARHHGY